MLHSAILRYCCWHCASSTRAEDLTQETFYKLIRSILQYDGKRKFKAYLYTIARNLCIDESRKEPLYPLDRLVLCSVVPYLVCMAVVLRCLRLHGKEGLTFSLTGVFASCAAWGICARTIPWLYEISATGIWIIAFLLFTTLFLREIFYILESRKEGNMYGIIA